MPLKSLKGKKGGREIAGRRIQNKVTKERGNGDKGDEQSQASRNGI